MRAAERAAADLDGIAAVLSERLDCGRFGEDRYTAACEERAETGPGFSFLLAVVLLVVGFLWWPRMSTKTRAAADPASRLAPSGGRPRLQ